MSPLEIPSPSWTGFSIGPLTIHAYALCILAGIAIAWTIGKRRFMARGGSSEQYENILGVAVLAGIVGARVYHVITDYQLYFGEGRNPWQALQIWNGGLGIWGAVAVGALAVWLMARRYGLPFAPIADAIAPGLLIAQAVGRIGNWFNQELFGGPTTLPWGLKIDLAHRPDGYQQFATFHPTFLYELIWNLLAAGVLLSVERRLGWGRGKIFASYVVLYTFGRFFIETLRIDPVNTPGGFRVNEYTSVIVFIAAVATLAWLVRNRPGTETQPLAPPTGDAAVSGE